MPPRHPLIELTLARFREFLREPEAVFWVFASRCCWPARSGSRSGTRARPTCSSACCAAAPRRTPTLRGDARAVKGVRVRAVDRAEADVAPAQRRHPAARGARATPVDLRTRSEPAREPGRPLRGGRRAAGAAGRRAALPVADRLVTVPGSRYIDWVVPGLLGMNIMGTGMWSVGVLGRAGARAQAAQAPDRHADAAPRLPAVAHGVAADLPRARGGRAARVRGARVRRPGATGRGCCCRRCACSGAVAFAGLGLLVASRAQTVEGVSGLMNLVMVPMWVFSGRVLRLREFPGGDAAVHLAAAADGAEPGAARRDDRRQRRACADARSWPS